MIARTLLLLALFCTAQDAVSPASLGETRSLQLLERSNVVAQPTGLFQCIPLLYKVWGVWGDVAKIIKDFSGIRSDLKNEIDKCKKLGGTEEEKCRNKAEEAAQKRSEDLYGEVQNLWPKVMDLLYKFKDCLFS